MCAPSMTVRHSPDEPVRRSGGVAPAEPPPESLQAAIWIGIEPCRPHASAEAMPPGVFEKISAFIEERFPAAQVDTRAQASFCLRCAGSLAEVMHIADDLGWHVRCLSGSDDLEAFDARMGVVLAADGETVASLLHRAEDAAESLAER